MPREVGSPRLRLSARVEAVQPEAWACTVDVGPSVEYLQPEEWQRWEGNQLLRTGRLTLYQVHLETNETLIIAPTASPPGLGAGQASGNSWGLGTETELHILTPQKMVVQAPCQRLTKSRSHCLVQRGLAITRGQIGASVVSALIIVVLHIEAG